MSLQPYYIPWEIPTVVVSYVYILPSANNNSEATLVAEDTDAMLVRYLGVPVLILGDFNTCSLDNVLTSFQHLCGSSHEEGKYPRQKLWKHTLCLPCTLISLHVQPDHNVICLLPLYREELKREEPRRYSAPQLSEDAITLLQGSLACTNWSVFDGDLNNRVSIITDYINFCIQTTIQFAIIKTYPNSKPWITPELRNSLKETHAAFKLNDWAGLKMLNRKVKNEVLKAELKNKNKLEAEFAISES